MGLFSGGKKKEKRRALQATQQIVNKKNAEIDQYIEDVKNDPSLYKFQKQKKIKAAKHEKDVVKFWESMKKDSIESKYGKK